MRNVLFAALMLSGCVVRTPEGVPSSVVAVQASNGWCSGVFVAEGVVLTAAHCAGYETRICDSRNRCSYAQRMAMRDAADLAWYSVGLKGSPAGLSTPRFGQVVTVLGQDGKRVETAVEAVHGGWSGFDLGYTAVRGDSGSPAFDSQGRVACIVTGAYTQIEGGTWCQGVIQ